MRTSRTLAAVAAAALALSACGGDDDTDAGTAAEETAAMDGSTSEVGNGSTSEETGDMDMGSADGDRADEVEAAELRENGLVPLDSAPEAFVAGTGKAYLALDPGTVLTVDAEGLAPDTEVVGHLHAEPCEDEGGPHFQFDPDGGDTPPNEVHLSATADDTGAFTVNVTNEQVASGARSVIIHAAGGDATKALCADLPPVEA